MPYENGVNWRPKAPFERGRHATFNAALEAAFKDLTTEKNAFFDSLVDEWGRLFPTLPARPGRSEDGNTGVGHYATVFQPTVISPSFTPIETVSPGA